MKYFPIKFHIIYILSTLLFSFYGPRIYANYDKFSVSLFILSYLTIVFISFKFGFRSRTIYSRNFQKNKNKLYVLFTNCLNISIIIYLIYFIYLFSSNRINLSISSIGNNYVEYYQYYSEKKETTEFTPELFFLIFLSIPKFISLTIGFLKFRKHENKIKYKFVFLILLIIFINTISSGNQKSLGDIIIIALLALMTNYKYFTNPEKQKIKIYTIIILLLSLLFFSFSQFQRLDSRSISIVELNRLAPDYYNYDINHPIFKLFGEKIGLGLTAFLSGYLSNGYYGLSICLNMPFEWSYGIGNSVALTNLTEKFTNIEVFNHTYLSRLEQFGLLGKMHWHTIFPWLASDLTFVGSIIAFIPIGYIYGKSWKESYIFNNDVSFLMFSLLSILFIFIPANNQIMHGYDAFLCTLFVSTYWILNHNKANNINLSNE